LGALYEQAERIDDAISAMESAIAGVPGGARGANFFGWHKNLIILYARQGRRDRAVSAARRCADCNPGDAAALAQFALALLLNGEPDRAEEQYSLALAADPNFFEAARGLAMARLNKGDLMRGAGGISTLSPSDLALRRMVQSHKLNLRGPAWDGAHIPNGTLYLVSDLGRGDIIQGARYLPLIRERVPHIIFGCFPELTPLLRCRPEIARFVSIDDPPPSHDAWLLWSDVAAVFAEAAFDTLLRVPYLTPPPALVAEWKTRLDGLVKPGFRVGITWAGDPANENDRHRSVRPQSFAPVLAVPGVQFIGIQKRCIPEDRAYAAQVGLPVLSDELESFADTAAVMANLDLIISVDASVCHVAGATGRPTWTLLFDPPEWRWLVGRQDTPWYPTMRLFRQPRPGAWAPVFESVAKALAERVAAT
jgi:hypothetical protein